MRPRCKGTKKGEPQASRANRRIPENNEATANYRQATTGPAQLQNSRKSLLFFLGDWVLSPNRQPGCFAVLS